jgi:GNAT superfamily N-acetyltransferase
MRALIPLLLLALATTTGQASDLFVFSPKGEKIPVAMRPATAKEIQLQLQADESDEPEKNTLRYWKKHPKAEYRWDLKSAGEIGLMSDIYKEVSAAFMMGEEVKPEFMPHWAVAEIEAKPRFLGIATTGGDIKFHANSEFRRQGYRGIGTVLVAHYLQRCLQEKRDAYFTSVNDSYGFYEKLGFKHADPEFTPAKVKNPALEQFPMVMALKDIPAALTAIEANWR